MIGRINALLVQSSKLGRHGPEVAFWETMGLPSPAALTLCPAPGSVSGVSREESAGAH